MSEFDFLDEEDLNESSDDFNMDFSTIKDEIPSFTSIKLCEMIVCNKYIGFAEEISIECMHELSNRRLNGDSFDYENFIDSKLNSLPKFDLMIPNLQDLLKKFK